MNINLAADNEHNEIDAFAFRTALMEWGQKHFRDFPWRKDFNPFHIMIAEIMLHRTQAQQVPPIYLDFINRYPDISSLAMASADEVHAIMYPLGLHWRTDLMIQMATEIVDHFHGQIPGTRGDLLHLPGVNDYICSAIRCFAWNLPEALIDTNTVRVVGRLHGIGIKDSSRRNLHVRQLISALVAPDKPREYSYSLLDLAAQVCVKRGIPNCIECPVNTWCRYGHQSRNGA